jgi:hypothetical protein
LRRSRPAAPRRPLGHDRDRLDAFATLARFGGPVVIKIRMRRARYLAACLLVGACASGNDFLEVERCFGLDYIEKQHCADEFIAEYAKSGKSTKDMLASLEEARKASSSFEENCHPVAHAIGRWTYLQSKDVSASFDLCDSSCHSGCFHGVVERVFYGDDELAQTRHLGFPEIEPKVPTVCDGFSGQSSAIQFQCFHGLGHAVLLALGYDLTTALRACDLLDSSYGQSSCYGGVFMENVNGFEDDLTEFREDDPHYPCNTLDEKYGASCYLMQTSAMLDLGMSDEEIGRACLDAGQFKGNCFTSFGRDMSNHVRTGDPGRAVSACEEHSKGFERDCIAGVVYALSDNTWDGRFAYVYCSALETEEHREICYRISNSYLHSTYGVSSDQLRTDCERWSDHRDTCASTIP